MTAVRTAVRFVREVDAGKFEQLLGQAVQEVAELGLEPRVSVSHAMNGPVSVYVAVVSGASVSAPGPGGP